MREDDITWRAVVWCGPWARVPCLVPGGMCAPPDHLSAPMLMVLRCGTTGAGRCRLNRLDSWRQCLELSA
jgi:hypothetical protein